MVNLASNSSKYNDIFREGKKLFWKHGIRRVSIEEICREAQVSKMTFYKYFPNKLELIKSILDQVFEESIEQFNKIFSDDITFSSKLHQLFHLKLNAMNSLSPELIRDIYTIQKMDLRQYLDLKVAGIKHTIIEFYKDSQAKGFIRKDVKIDFIMAYSNHMSKLLEDDVLLAAYKKPQDLVMEMMNSLFYGIVEDHE